MIENAVSIIFVEEFYEEDGVHFANIFVSNAKFVLPGDAWIVRDGQRVAHVLLCGVCFRTGFCFIRTLTQGKGERLPELRLGDTIEECDDITVLEYKW